MDAEPSPQKQPASFVQIEPHVLVLTPELSDLVDSLVEDEQRRTGLSAIEARQIVETGLLHDLQTLAEQRRCA